MANVHSIIPSRYYSNLSEAVLGYKLPLAYFLTGLAIYVYSFVATLRKCVEFVCLQAQEQLAGNLINSPSVCLQNGQELPHVQVILEGRRVHFLLETLHRLGLPHR